MATSPKAPSTDAPSPTSHQTTLQGLDSGTSSPGSAGGLTPSDSLESRTAPPSGPAPVPASRSRTRARGAEFATLDIFGQHGSRSSGSAALQSSLESRLRQQLASGGSTLFSLTWNDAVTPSGRRICALRASARRTSDSGCTSWPTPTVSRGDYSYARGDHEAATLKLAGAAKMSHWPTPTANTGGGQRGSHRRQAVQPLRHGPPGLVADGDVAGLEVVRKQQARRQRATPERGSAIDPLADPAPRGRPEQEHPLPPRSDQPHAVRCRSGVPDGATRGFWAGADWLLCRDPTGGPPVARAVEPGTFPLVTGLPERVGLLSGYGNAIVPQVAAKFITAALESLL